MRDLAGGNKQACHSLTGSSENPQSADPESFLRSNDPLNRSLYISAHVFHSLMVVSLQEGRRCCRDAEVVHVDACMCVCIGGKAFKVRSEHPNSHFSFLT